MSRVGLDSIAVRGVWLHKRGDYVIVEVEIGDKWVEIISEHKDGEFSHIAEPAGIEDKAKRGA